MTDTRFTELKAAATAACRRDLEECSDLFGGLFDGPHFPAWLASLDPQERDEYLSLRSDIALAIARLFALEAARAIIERAEIQCAGGLRSLSPNRRSLVRPNAVSRKLGRVRRYIAAQQRDEVHP